MDKLELLPGKPVIIKTQVGEEYSVVTNSGDTSDLLNNVIVKRVGNDIVLLYPNNIEIVFTDFYLVCLETEACSINLPAAEGGVFTLTGAESATDLGDGSSLIYVYGNTNTLLAMAKDNDALQSLFNSYDDAQISYLTSVEPVETSSSIGLLSSGILGIGALSGMSGDASNAPEVGSVTYDISAILGPLIDNGEGSIVSLYKADGTKLGEATFDVETQRFIFEDISSYTGVVIACLQDKDDTADYMDEATVQAKDIPTDLFLVTTVTAADQGQTVSFTITPLSAIAAMQAGVVVADNNVSISANTEQVSSANIAVANAFGLNNIELDRAEVKPTIDSAGVNTINSNTYGQVLALISAWEDATNATENGNDTITYFNNHFSATDLSNLVKAELVSAADIIELPRNEVIKLLNYSPTDSDLLQAIGKYANEIDSTAKNAPGLCAELLNEIEGIDGAVIGNEAAYEEYIVSNPSKFSETATLSEVQAMVHIVNAITYINKALGNNDMANPSIDHFVNADVTGVNESNLSAINELLTSKNTDAIDTTAEIQSVVNSYNTIFNAANGINDDDTKPEANDYSTIGVSGVNSIEKVSLMGDILDIKTSSDVDSLAKLQGLVDIVNKIMQHSESTPQLITQNELESIGITNLTPDRTQDLLSKIANTLNDNSVIDTLSEIQAMVDTTAPIASINLDKVTTDAIININEADMPNITITGEVSDDVKEGDMVSLLVNGKTYTGNVLTDNTFSIEVASGDLASDTRISASVTITDTAGNSTTATNATTYSVDTTPPSASISLDTIATDNIINASEANQDITITGTVGDDVQEGDAVILTVNSTEFIGEVLADNTFSISVSGSDLASDTSISASVTITDTAGNSNTATDAKTYSVDTTPPSASITLDTVSTDNIINASESSQDINITGTVGDDVQEGDAVILTVNSTEFIGEVLADKTFSIAVSGSNLASDTSISASVTTTDTAGNSTTATETKTYSVDTTPPNASITLDTITTDNIINASEANQDITITGTVGDDVQVGDTVTLTVNGQTSTGLVQEDNTFSIAVSGSDLAADTSISASVTITDKAGNITTATDDNSYSVDITPPSASITLDTIATDNIINASESTQNITITGTVGNDIQAGDTVTLTINGQSTEGQVNENGTFSIALAGSDLASDTSISASVTTTDTAGNSTTATVDKSYSVDTTPPSASITLDDVTDDNTINASEADQEQEIAITGAVTVDGDVQAGDTVTLTVNDQSTEGQVNENGNFSIAVSGSNLALDADTSIEASVTTTDTAGNSTTVTVDKIYSVDTQAPTLSLSSPNDGEEDVAVSSNIVLTFSEDVNVGSGDIVIYSSDGTAFETIAVTDSDKVTVNDAQVTINPSNNFASSTEYYVQIAATAFEDSSGNPYAGITDTTTLNFTSGQPQLGIDNYILTDTTNSGINLNLINPIEYDGKYYYFLDQNNNNTPNGGFSPADGVSHDALDDLLNNGDDTIVTQQGFEGHDGTDDERSVVIDGFTLILPTTAELQDLFNNVDVDSDENGYPFYYYWSSDTTVNSETHHTLMADGGNPSGSGDTQKNIVIFQIMQSPVSQVGVENFSLNDTITGEINLDLIFLSEFADKNYYYLDHDGDGSMTTDDHITFKNLEGLLNNGDDITVLPEQEVNDDHRSIIIDGFKLVLPGAMELVDYFQSGEYPHDEGESWSANPWDQAPNHHWVINWQNNEAGYSAEADSNSYPVIFQVIPLSNIIA